ncbi:MAG: 3-oxoadipyl-CoA thiolase [Deltaproteobacteria bacterium]|nr:3-oxoadipyl-CoA thiolase [Deltaproteobacteria bacterium]
MAEAFVCDAVRTPVGRYAGALASVRTDDLAATPIKALMARSPKVDWAAVDDVILGCANQAGEDNRNVGRMAALLAGLAPDVPGATVNRLCGSGMDAVASAARAIRAGEAELFIAGGVESMSRAPFVIAKADSAFARHAEIFDTTIGWRFVNPQMKERYGIDGMGETAENLAALHNIARADQDAFAWRSQERWGRAQQAGVFKDEIVPVVIPQRRGDAKVVDTDEHPRPSTTLEELAKLKPAFRAGGTVTPGNSSGVNDGAAALLIASEHAAKAYGLTPRARIVGTSVAGVLPRLMGIGPVPATRKVLAKTGLTLSQMEVIELNEAFAAQGLAVLRSLELEDDAAQVNPNGGAIAIGHPLGMSGARLVTTATYELARKKGRYALCTMCIGVGQGIAMVLERA